MRQPSSIFGRARGMALQVGNQAVRSDLTMASKLEKGVEDTLPRLIVEGAVTSARRLILTTGSARGWMLVESVLVSSRCRVGELIDPSCSTVFVSITRVDDEC